MPHAANESPASPLTFGLDIGIASVGWAVLSHQHIEPPRVSRRLFGLS